MCVSAIIAMITHHDICSGWNTCYWTGLEEYSCCSMYNSPSIPEIGVVAGGFECHKTLYSQWMSFLPILAIV